VSCTIARIQLAELAVNLSAAAGVSEFNAAELRAAGAAQAEVIPVLFDRGALGEPGPPPQGPPTILFVGRLAPHKRQDRVIRAFAMYRRHRAPDARLVLVGNPVTPPYGMTLRTLADELAPGAVTIESGLSPEALWDRYRSAHAFLCLSEHEGFCVPLLEAFHFGVPVIARPAGGVPEVAGDAALLTDDDDLAVIAELMHLALSDSELRAELIARGHRRLEEFAYERTAQRLRAAVSRLAA
jgi:glycosyltransferase involved in cell wall biosynthesis